MSKSAGRGAAIAPPLPAGLSGGRRRQPQTVRVTALALMVSSLFSMLSLLAVSVWIHARTGSYALSAAVFGVQWAVPLLWPTGVGRFRPHAALGGRAAAAEWLAAVVLVMIVGAVAARQPFVVIGLVAVRGFLEAVTRATSTLLAMAAVDESNREPAVAHLEFVRIVGTSAAGVLFALLEGRVGILALLVVAAGALVATGAAYRLVGGRTRTAETAARPDSGPAVNSLRALLKAAPVARIPLWQLAVVAAFQGTHNAIRVAYPDQVLGQPVTGVGIVSAVSTVGVLCGGWAASRRSVLPILAIVPPSLLAACVAVPLIVAVALTSPLPSYATYFLFMLVFEVAFMRLNVNVVNACAGPNAAMLLGLRSAVTGAGALLGLSATAALLIPMRVWPATALAAAALVIIAVMLDARARHAARQVNHALP